MIDGRRNLISALRSLITRFQADAKGQIAIIFALVSIVVVIGIGSGIDLSRAYNARQKLSQAATLTCQYSTRTSVADAGAFVNYVQQVNTYAPSALASQNWNATIPVTAANQSGTAYFSATAPSGASASTAVNGVTEMWANIPTTFLRIANVTNMPVHAIVSCQTPPPPSGPYVLQEGFETPCNSYCLTKPNGSNGTTSGPQSTFPSTPGYLGSGGAQWFITGYCLETDIVGQISTTTPEGTHSAELDCDNGSGSAGNSSLSTKVTLSVGYYELRYNYRSRVFYPDYDPVYVCGSTAADLSWANDTSGGSLPLRTNQINVYLDQNTTGAAPLHTTIDGSQQLAGSNLIDMCVYSTTWIERSVKIKITTAGTYWLSFAADGANDSYGGQLDNIRVCVDTCPTTLQDNFPSTWLAANNGNVNKLLFEDSFAAPTYAGGYYPWIALNGNLNASTGTTVTSTCSNAFGTYQVPPGWTCQPAAGWATAPYNQVNYFVQGAEQGSQYISVDGNNNYSSGTATRNRTISRPFLLDPGYYNISYYYISDVDFSSSGAYGTNCYAAPGSGFIFAASYPNLSGNIRFFQPVVTDGTTNILASFMSYSTLISTPIGGGALGSTTSYLNPDGTTTTTPTVPPDNVNWSSYNAGAVNPVLDVCGYVDSFRWVPRSVNIKITKPGMYWLTLSGNGGLADGNGGGIDDVKLTALGSPYMSNPPFSPLVSIPVPAPQPDTVYTGNGAFTGFYTIAAPFTPPAADQ